jgi:ferredoxin-fold anticodon binding domain-containing protein
MLVVGGNERENTSMKVLTSRITKLEKLQETTMQVVKLHEFSSGIEHYGVDKIIQKNNSILVIMLCGFQRAISHA